jgi:ABC-type nitrate/sulfonate/bicarbonate transport system permease component
MNRNAMWVRRGAIGTAGIALMLGLWELIGRVHLLGPSWPPFSQVVRSLVSNWDIFAGSLLATMAEAGEGFVIGMAVGICLGATSALFPVLRRPIGNLATLVYSVPWIALGPLIVVMVSSQNVIPRIFAVLAVFFSSFISITSGFNFASEAHHDLLSVLGASRWTRFVRLLLPSALPSIIDGAKVAAPSAVLGAIFGEWFGSIKGLGVLILTSMQLLLNDRLWAAAGLTAALVIVTFGLLSLLQYGVTQRFR